MATNLQKNPDLTPVSHEYSSFFSNFGVSNHSDNTKHLIMETSILFPGDNDTLRDHGREKLKPFSLYNSETGRRRPLGIIAAVGRRGELGRAGDLIWHLPGDLRRFKAVTVGHPVIMGRKTWDSLPKKPLPGRRNIVVTRDEAWSSPGAERARSLEDALAMCDAGEMPYVIGGASVYAEAMPYATSLSLTLVDAECDDADVFFPEVSPDDWRVSGESPVETSPDGISYRYVDYLRK